MSNNEDINIGDILPPKKDAAEKFTTAETRVPGFLKQAAYSPDETREETIKRDWERLIVGLSDYVLAEQLTEYELRGMGKPVAENYSMYFNTTLKEVRKNRKKGEQRLFKFIPAHSQLDCEAFFETVHEQNEKEKEARLKAIEQYPPAGVAKMDYNDDARKGLQKTAAAYCQTCGKDAKPGDPAHDKHTVIDLPADPDPKEEAAKRQKRMDALKKEASEPFCYSCNKRLASEETTLHARRGHNIMVEAVGPHTKMDPKEEEDLKKSLEKVLPAAAPAAPAAEKAPAAEPAKEAVWTSPDAQQGSQTNQEAAACTHCKNDIPAKKGLVLQDKPYCMPCHDAGHSTPANAASPAKPAQMPPMSTSTGPMTNPLLHKEASAKWENGALLKAKHNGVDACIVHVNNEDKTYVIKVEGTMYPSYYSFDDAHATFNAVKKTAAAVPGAGAAGDASGVSGSPGGAVTVTITNTHTDHNPAETSTRTDHNPAKTGDSGAGADAEVAAPVPAAPAAVAPVVAPAPAVAVVPAADADAPEKESALEDKDEDKDKDKPADKPAAKAVAPAVVPVPAKAETPTAPAAVAPVVAPAPAAAKPAEVPAPGAAVGAVPAPDAKGAGAAGDASGVSGSPGGAVTVTITNTHTDHNPAETSTRTDHNPAETGDSGAGADAKVAPAPAAPMSGGAHTPTPMPPVALVPDAKEAKEKGKGLA